MTFYPKAAGLAAVAIACKFPEQLTIFRLDKNRSNVQKVLNMGFIYLLTQRVAELVMRTLEANLRMSFGFKSQMVLFVATIGFVSAFNKIEENITAFVNGILGKT